MFLQLTLNFHTHVRVCRTQNSVLTWSTQTSKPHSVSLGREGDSPMTDCTCTELCDPPLSISLSLLLHSQTAALLGLGKGWWRGSTQRRLCPAAALGTASLPGKTKGGWNKLQQPVVLLSTLMNDLFHPRSACYHWTGATCAISKRYIHIILIVSILWKYKWSSLRV